jgi:hypothetical protein
VRIIFSVKGVFIIPAKNVCPSSMILNSGYSINIIKQSDRDSDTAQKTIPGPTTPIQALGEWNKAGK